MSLLATSRRAFLRRAAAAAAVAAPAIWIPRRAAAQLNAPGFVAGLARAAGGESLQDSYQYGQTDGNSIDVGDNWSWWAYSFVAAASYTLSRFRVWAEQRGSPSYNATPYIYSNSSGEPGSALTGGTGTLFALSSAPAAGSPAAFDLTGFSCAITSGTTYWLVFHASNYSQTNNLRIWTNLETGQFCKRNGTGLTPWGNTAPNKRLGWEAYGS